jgi:ABC-type nitrate/sulfonate/bicarbonate transport system substrate-binding protein
MAGRCARSIMVIVALTPEVFAALVGAPGPALAQNLEPVSVIVFPGGFNWPIWVAQEKGYFAKDGIEVRLTPSKASSILPFRRRPTRARASQPIRRA